MKTTIGSVLAIMTFLVSAAHSQTERSVWDGVYTEQQAARGLAVFTASCASCHGPTEFAGDSFLGAWDASTAVDFYTVLQNTMPMSSPGSLKPEEYADVVAYLFKINAFPAGEGELPSDRALLKLIRIERKKQ